MVLQTVTDITKLQSIINNTPPNSTISIQNGTYTVTSIITIAVSNITLKAQTPNGVIFTGGNISFNITGNNNVFDGIQFLNTSANMSTVGGNNFNSYNLISVSGNNNTLSNITPTKKKNETKFTKKINFFFILVGVKAPRRALGYFTITTFYGCNGYPILLEFVFSSVS